MGSASSDQEERVQQQQQQAAQTRCTRAPHHLETSWTNKQQHDLQHRATHSDAEAVTRLWSLLDSITLIFIFINRLAVVAPRAPPCFGTSHRQEATGARPLLLLFLLFLALCAAAAGMMLALAFTCRVLLGLLVSEPVPVEPVRTAPFLITENMWPRGCVLDCQRGRHRAVCGSNGRLYKSLCAFQRAQCINTHLRPAPRAHCSDPSQSKCQLARSQALDASSHSSSSSHVSPAAAIFVPECSLDGHFLPVQCHNQTGYCWCSTPDGKPVGGTSVLHLTPNCTEQITRMSELTNMDAAPIRDQAGVPRPTLDTRRPTELTAPPFWVTILLNSDPKGNRSVRRPTDSPLTCERERLSLLSQMRSAWQEERFIPECTADGRYSPVQCHVATGYCWCVRVDSGRPLPGTSARNRLPECTGIEVGQTDRRFREKPLPGCPGARKKEFLQSLVRALQQEAEHAGSLHQASSTPPLDSPSPSPNPPTSSAHPSSSSASSSSPLDLPPPAPESVESSRPEVALRWHFSKLDVDASGVLSEREARPLRQYLRRRLKPRRCAKKFAQYCDRDGDRGLTLEELRVCLGL